MAIVTRPNSDVRSRNGIAGEQFSQLSTRSSAGAASPRVKMPKVRTGKKKGKRKIAGRKIKEKEGAAVQYLTRNQAIKRLQVLVIITRTLEVPSSV